MALAKCKTPRKDYLSRLARDFVELVHREEMLKAERHASEPSLVPPLTVAALTAVCMLAVVLLITRVSHVLPYLVSLSTVGCAVAFFHEDLSLRVQRLLLVFPGTSLRLSFLEGMVYFR